MQYRLYFFPVVFHAYVYAVAAYEPVSFVNK